MSTTARISKRIKEIAEEIEILSEELNALLIIDKATTTTQSDKNYEDNDDTITLGNVVEIRNTYTNLQGSRGTVINVTSQQVTIKLENTNKTVRRKKTNVKKI